MKSGAVAEWAARLRVRLLVALMKTEHGATRLDRWADAAAGDEFVILHR